MAAKTIIHVDEIDRNTYDPAPAASVVSSHQQAILDLADAMYLPPVSLNSAYLQKCERAASFLRNPSNLSAQNISKAIPVGFTSGNSQRPTITPKNDASSTTALRNSVTGARNNVFAVVNQVGDFAVRARNAGYFPTTNPFVIISQKNATRKDYSPLNISSAEADQLVTDINAFLDLIAANKSGEINIDSDVPLETQISSATLSLKGFGGSGDTLQDLLRFLPDADEIKEQKAKELLGALSFTKRVPKVLFTAEDETKKSCIVGWKRMPDASGYVLKRKNLLDGSEKQFMLKNEDVLATSAELSDFVQKWILSFYDNVPADSVLCFVDSSISENAYYFYRVQAYQIQKSLNSSVFSVDTITANMPAAQRAQIKSQLLIADPTSGGSSVSPYPLLAKQLLGNDSYDWVLAGVNICESIKRGDTRTDTRQFSYLSAQLDFLFAQMDVGKFVVPKNLNAVLDDVNSSVIQFGISQTIQDLLQETGCLYFFEGKDSRGDSFFYNSNSDPASSSPVLTAVLSTIDPETATLDLDTLAATLPQLLSLAGDSSPTEIDPNGQDIVGKLEIQFLSSIDSGSVLDLTTSDGLGKLLRSIRIFSDLGPNKGSPTTAVYVEQSPPVLPTNTTIRPPVSKINNPDVQDALDDIRDKIQTKLGKSIDLEDRKK